MRFSQSSTVQKALSTSELVLAIARQRVIASYSQSFLWVFWVLISPLFQILLFIFLKNTSVIRTDAAYLPYFAYLFLSLILWQPFVMVLRNSCNMLQHYRYLQTIRFSREALLYGDVLVALCSTFFMSFVFVCVLLVHKISLSAGMLFLPVIIFFIMLLATGLAKILMVLSALTRDVLEGMYIVVLFWLFATPSIYRHAADYHPMIERLNPMHIFIKTAHTVWAGGGGGIPGLFWVHCAVAVTIFGAGTWVFQRTIHIALERI